MSGWVQTDSRYTDHSITHNACHINAATKITFCTVLTLVDNLSTFFRWFFIVNFVNRI
jgi:hypothetical protein